MPVIQRVRMEALPAIAFHLLPHLVKRLMFLSFTKLLHCMRSYVDATELHVMLSAAAYNAVAI